MKSKTLLIAAAALAAGVMASSAAVYSQNVVGYVNVVLSANALTPIGTPLDNGTNDLNSMLSTLPSKSTVQVWNGSGYTAYTKGATWPTGVFLPPGKGFFAKSFNATTTNTFAGQVIVLAGGSVTNVLAANTLYFVGSPIPFSTDLNNTNLGLNVLPAKSTVQVWNGAGYTAYTKGATWPAYTNPVANGFFVKSFGTQSTWVQNFNP